MDHGPRNLAVEGAGERRQYTRSWTRDFDEHREARFVAGACLELLTR
jgi:hypothetical protein